MRVSKSRAIAAGVGGGGKDLRFTRDPESNSLTLLGDEIVRRRIEKDGNNEKTIRFAASGCSARFSDDACFSARK